MKNKTPRSPLSCSRLEDRQLLAYTGCQYSAAIQGAVLFPSTTSATCDFIHGSFNFASDSLTWSVTPSIISDGGSYFHLRLTAIAEANPSGASCTAVLDSVSLNINTFNIVPTPINGLCVGASGITLPSLENFIPLSCTTSATQATFSVIPANIGVEFADNGSLSITTLVLSPALPPSEHAAVIVTNTKIGSTGQYALTLNTCGLASPAGLLDSGLASPQFVAKANLCRAFSCLNDAEKNLVEDATAAIERRELGKL